MNRDDSRLLRHLGIAIAVKLAVIAGLWWVFVHGSVVTAGSEQTASHLLTPTGPSTPPSPQPTPSHPNRQEPAQ